MIRSITGLFVVEQTQCSKRLEPLHALKSCCVLFWTERMRIQPSNQKMELTASRRITQFHMSSNQSVPMRALVAR